LPHFDRQGLACAASRVGYETEKRAPLLLIAGENDHTFPAPLTRSAFRQYRQSKAVTGYEEFPGRSHYSIGEPGWENVAGSRRAQRAWDAGCTRPRPLPRSARFRGLKLGDGR
jgi:pimeloyl-ACP methyl ester carboxylesterase